MRKTTSMESTYKSFDCVDCDITGPEIPSPCPSSGSGWSYRDEILLDPDDRPLELAVNSKSPLTFHLVAGADRNAELLRILGHEGFSPEQRRRLIEKFNLNPDNTDDDKSSMASSPSTPRRRTSLSGSSSGSIRRSATDTRRKTASPLVAAMAKFGNGEVAQNSNQKVPNGASKTPTHRPERKTSSLRRSQTEIKYSTLPIKHDKSDSHTRTGRMRSVKQKQKNATIANRREPRSASARRLFFSLRKSRARSASRERGDQGAASESEESTSPTKSAELSSDVNLPGILKIFGDAVSPGANYKSVMATRQSNAQELVKMALQRYGIPRQQAKDFVLCEVVGRVQEEEPQAKEALNVKPGKTKKTSRSMSLDSSSLGGAGANFQEDLVRPLSDNDKPLLLQSYWKPLDGHSRRFEIRRRSKVFKKVEKDHATRDINNQARRLILQKSRTHMGVPVPDQPQTDSEESDTEENGENPVFSPSGEQTNTYIKTPVEPTPPSEPSNAAVEPPVATPPSSPEKTASDVESDVRTSTSSQSASPNSVEKAPPVPCLITLQGDVGKRGKEESLVHYLKQPETLIGSKASDFRLNARDVLPHHCVMKRRLEILFSDADDATDRRWHVTVIPLHAKAEVTANGFRVTSEYSLQHGDLITIGKHSMFMFKDPSSNVNLSNKFSFSELSKSIPATPEKTPTRKSQITPAKTQKSPSKSKPIMPTELTYALECEDQVLRVIFDSLKDVDDQSVEYPFAPAALLCQCIFHSCLNFRLENRNDLLLKIASNLQTLVLNSTRNVSVQEIQSPDLGNNINLLLPSLRPVVYWMSNSLEIFEFLQKNLIPKLHERVSEERSRGVVDPAVLDEIEEFEVNEEILALLEEVVMYAFQQLVYYLTKTLYSYLPAVLDCNPFSDVTDGVLVDHVTGVYESAREMVEVYDVNQQISDQLFAYLFFFTNVSLFNTLMEDEANERYYKWDMGARIRGNLEQVESWACDAGYPDQCTTFLEKVSALVNLLATPRTQITKGSWTHFRQTYPSLEPAQLHHVLSGYQLPNNHVKPQAWSPFQHEPEASLDTNLVMESYDQHPPLMLPVTGTRIDFQQLPTDPWFESLQRRVAVAGNSLSSPARNRIDSTQVGVREQPDGREIPQETASPSRDVKDTKRDVTTNVSSDTSSSVRSKSTHHLGETASVGGQGRIVSSSSCSSSSSEPEGYVIRQHRSRHRKASDLIGRVSPSEAINELLDSKSKIEDEERGKACDEVLLLPVSETTSLATQVSTNRVEAAAEANPTSPQPQGGAQGMPKEVFIVDIKKGRNGLGVGLVDGSVTSLVTPGVYVRSLVPDAPGTKHGHTKHHDVIKCWLQEGRLQLGDRILAANGVSLLNMSYNEATKTVRQAGDYVRLLVGRCGNEVAMKITSSSC
uniref:Ras-associating and dilute domain-containing protein-like n=1 Tax=Phallusia mammillata TaxID=59560 RepID=A0A6F9DQF0_9ASCI|nr:ras-associating and dilute domain-containing protein-like [Phallusia mammillata]